jgi:CitMHS family citrate-Mg2+:H+ or citrate-Ca2+:H+ symporter
LHALLFSFTVHQLNPLVAANHVLIGLAAVEFGDHQEFMLKWALLLAVVMILIAGIAGIVPLY